MSKVKCIYCEKEFDNNVEEYVKPKNNRYAHAACCTLDNDAYVKDMIRKVAREHLGSEYKPQKVNSQIVNFEKQGITLVQIYQAVQYWYEVLTHTPEKANGGIGIVPSIYEEAEEYYQNKEKRKEVIASQVIEAEELEPLKIQVQRTPPQRPHQYRIIDLK